MLLPVLAGSVLCAAYLAFVEETDAWPSIQQEKIPIQLKIYKDK